MTETAWTLVQTTLDSCPVYDTSWLDDYGQALSLFLVFFLLKHGRGYTFDSTDELTSIYNHMESRYSEEPSKY